MYGWWMCELVLKLRGRGANIVDAIENRDLQIVFGVPVGRQGAVDEAALTPASDRTGNPSSLGIWISITAIFAMPIAV